MQVFSIVHGVVRVELFVEPNININQRLIDEFYADKGNESVDSQVRVVAVH